MQQPITDRSFNCSQYYYNTDNIIIINNKKLFPLPKKQFRSSLELIHNALHAT